MSHVRRPLRGRKAPAGHRPRPDLSLKRLTPGNHDELLFDDVLWVERAQWEHDQFVAGCASAASKSSTSRTCWPRRSPPDAGGRRRLIELVATEYVVGPSLVDDVARGPGRASRRTTSHKHLIGGLTVAESGLDLGACSVAR